MYFYYIDRSSYFADRMLTHLLVGDAEKRYIYYSIDLPGEETRGNKLFAMQFHVHLRIQTHIPNYTPHENFLTVLIS